MGAFLALQIKMETSSQLASNLGVIEYRRK